jgi:hypothetical protein
MMGFYFVSLLPRHYYRCITRRHGVLLVLEDLVEIDSLILDLGDRDYATAATAYEELKRKCSFDWDAFSYLQERVHDARISERARNKMHEIISLIRMRAEVNQLLGIW